MTSAQLPSSPAVLPGTHAVRRQAFEQLHERAITLRRAGRSRREIKEILGITSNATLNEALRGEPPQAWTRRPRAKDDLHAQARQLRERASTTTGGSKAGSAERWPGPILLDPTQGSSTIS